MDAGLELQEREEIVLLSRDMWAREGEPQIFAFGRVNEPRCREPERWAESWKLVRMALLSPTACLSVCLSGFVELTPHEPLRIPALRPAVIEIGHDVCSSVIRIVFAVR